MFFNNQINENATNTSKVNYLANEEALPVHSNSPVFDFNEAGMNILIESEANWGEIMRINGLNEEAYYAANLTEMPISESVASGFIDSLKKFFINLGQKIKGLFLKFVAILDGWVKNDKDFVKKYERTIKANAGKVTTYNGFEFVNLDKSVGSAIEAAYKVTGLPDSMDANTAATDNTVPDNAEDMMRAAAAKAMGSSAKDSRLSSGEFKKELFAAFRKNETSKHEISVSGSDAISLINGYEKAKTVANKAYKEIENSINKTLGELNTVKGKVNSAEISDDNTKRAAQLGEVIKYTKLKLNIGATINSSLLTALKDQNRQARSICVSIVNASPASNNTNAQNESANISGNFESVSFI